jgi:hypothetical protein
MKKIAILAILAFLFAVATPVFAGPFSDVKPGHWAYEAVSKLAAKGIIEGYPDGKFKGGKSLTRYEMAMIIARLIEKGVAGGDMEKLTVEFADELALLGIKVTALEDEVRVIRNDVDGLKASMDEGAMGGKVRTSYDVRLRWDSLTNSGLNAGVASNGRDQSNFTTRFRTNLFVPKTDENISGMFSLQYQDDWANQTPNNPFAVAGNFATGFTNLGLYLAYFDVKNFGQAADLRIGRQTVTLGYGLVLDDQIDGVTFKRSYRGTNFGIGAYDLRGYQAITTNAGITFKTLTIDKAWRDIAAGLYYGGLDRAEPLTAGTYLHTIAGPGNLTVGGVHVDGKIGRNLVGTLEYAQTTTDNLTTAIAGNGLASLDETGYKLGLDWAINKDWDLAAWDVHRGINFVQLPVNDDYSDSAFYMSQGYNNFVQTKAGALCLPASNYWNANAMSVVLGYNAMKNLRLDLWLEALAGDQAIAGALDGVFDQTATQLVGTYQYRDNTAFKLRYRQYSFDTSDADYLVTPVSDKTEVRLDMCVKF